MGEADELLVEIQKAIGCSYLSDLHFFSRLNNKKSRTHILDIPAERFSLQAWNEAVSYITGSTCRFKTVEQAKKKLLNPN